ncbi:MAG: 16S rRNA (guanine(966)-N(2))-methyltransferase RsmD [Gemmatimonadota bacterium]|nr:MAG: 16S rRNA (guanine(966)-N(2))-methyltransferase RsmD [Gemmatimonadota bacterium]
MGELRIVAGRWGRRRLRVPRGRSLRPTSERVREAWMNALGPELDGASVLDLFAGSGALGLEALSRGARHATFVERSSRLLGCLRANVAALEATELVTIVAADVFAYLDGLGPGAFDIAVADPPYGGGLAARLVESYRRSPFARILSVEHGSDEALASPSGALERRYGDTMVTFIAASDLEEE